MSLESRATYQKRFPAEGNSQKGHCVQEMVFVGCLVHSLQLTGHSILVEEGCAGKMEAHQDCPTKQTRNGRLPWAP